VKLIREYINEKFIEEGDPIQAMGIGGIVTKEKWEELIKEYESNWRSYLNETFRGKTIKGKFWRENTGKNTLSDNDLKNYIIVVKIVRFRWNESQKEFYDKCNTLLISPAIIFVDENDERYWHFGEHKIFILE
jgi:hypothetical protein